MSKRRPPYNELLAQTEELCALHNIRPSRSKGQNFLIDESAYDAMIEAADLSSDNIVLEVGPGLGFLTERLAERTQKVIAVELDDTIAPVLRARVLEKKINNVSIHNEDVLNFTGQWATEAKAAGDKLVVVTNLPYNISSIFLRKFISGNEGGLLPDRLTLMLQKEVAERIIARAGQMSVLAVSVQFYATAEIKKIIPAESFWPKPVIASAVISFTRSSTYTDELSRHGIGEDIFFRIVKIGFSARRKMLKANLAAGLQRPVTDVIAKLERAGISLTARPQELSVADWIKTVVELSEFVV